MTYSKDQINFTLQSYEELDSATLTVRKLGWPNTVLDNVLFISKKQVNRIND